MTAEQPRLKLVTYSNVMLYTANGWRILYRPRGHDALLIEEVDADETRWERLRAALKQKLFWGGFTTGWCTFCAVYITLKLVSS